MTWRTTRPPAEAWRPPATGHRYLAARVIDQAFRDASAGSPADRSSAYDFLAGSSMLYYWCEVAGLNPTWVIARAKARLDRVPSR